MDNEHVIKKDEIEIDIIHLLRVLWSKAWIIIISMIIGGVGAFAYSSFMITPLYQSRAMMYVNNSSVSFGGTSLAISSGELTTARNLLDTYLVILKSRSTLEMVIDQADLDYKYNELSDMISASAVNETEVFEIIATSSDPAEAELIVDTITDILPGRISEIVDGSSVRIVDTAVMPTGKSSPNNVRNGLLGVIIGAVLSCGVIVVIDLFDTSVRDEEYLKEKYDLPILAVIPDMYSNSSKSYSYYKDYYRKNEDTSNTTVNKK